jgi:hypothetical protein
MVNARVSVARAILIGDTYTLRHDGDTILHTCGFAK